VMGATREEARGAGPGESVQATNVTSATAAVRENRARLERG